MPAPVILFAYNRPDHTARALRSLASADMAQTTDLLIFCDGPKETAEDAQRTAKVRETCHGAKGFRSVNVVERERNMGLAANIIDGVGQVIKERGRVIVLEDDLTVSGFFLRYMNAALDYYEGRGVFSVAGYSPELDLPKDYSVSTYMMHRNCSWGWATWRSRWEKVDWDVATFDTFIRDSRRRRAFNECGDDLSPMLLRWKTGEINSWSIRFCYAGFACGEPTVYPRKSLVRNGGADGSGTNVGATNRYDTPLAANIGIQNFCTGVAPDHRLVSQFRKFYDTSVIRRIINTLKRWRYIALGR